MNTKDRQKMCPQCDGRIPIEATACPYCASAQTATPVHEEDDQFYRQKSLQDSLTTLYSPPYSAKNPGYGQTDTNRGFSFMKQTDSFKDAVSEKRLHTAPSLGAPQIPADMHQEACASDEKSGFWPILLLSIGANLLTIGFLQLFFSDRGFLRLEWDSSHWFIYCLAALPLLFLGYKKTTQLK
ncbi:MAG: hypothetical protein HYZ48_04765 [Chlamydiales bacterium]|nr:hypothetical protein [Chlamydiales bacterium]